MIFLFFYFQFNKSLLRNLFCVITFKVYIFFEKWTINLPHVEVYGDKCPEYNYAAYECFPQLQPRIAMVYK